MILNRPIVDCSFGPPRNWALLVGPSTSIFWCILHLPQVEHWIWHPLWPDGVRFRSLHWRLFQPFLIFPSKIEPLGLEANLTSSILTNNGESNDESIQTHTNNDFAVTPNDYSISRLIDPTLQQSCVWRPGCMKGHRNGSFGVSVCEIYHSTWYSWFRRWTGKCWMRSNISIDWIYWCSHVWSLTFVLAHQPTAKNYWPIGYKR